MPNRDATLAEIIADRAAEAGGAVYLEDARSDRVLSFAELAARVADWTGLFDRLQLPPSAAVLVDAGDPLAFAVVHLATISSGRRSIPVDAATPASELERLHGLIRGAALIATDGDADRAVAGVARARIGADLRPAEVTAQTPPDSADPAGVGSAVLFTSGSSGTPKGVELPEPQLLVVAREVADVLELTPGERGFNSLPLHHVNAEVVGLLASLVAGSTLVLDRRFRRTGFWELLADRRITWLNAVPAILAVLARSGPIEPPEGLRLIRCASAPLPDHVRDELGGIPLVLSWGMTEGASQITSTGIGDGAPGAVGLPRGAEVRVRRQAEAGAESSAVPPLADADEVGALEIRGPGVVRRYLFDAAADRFDEEGWLSTGDLGSVSADGVVRLAGRADDVINRGGEKVYPGEVEEVLLEDPRVLEAVVVGRPHDVLGAVPVAYVIPVAELAAEDYPSLRDDLEARAEQHLARFRRPTEITVVEDLPRAAAGKVQRSRVRELELHSADQQGAGTE